MLRLLSQYLFQFHILPLPGLGMLAIKRQSALLNRVDKKIYPSDYSVEYVAGEGELHHIAQWLELHLNTSADEATDLLKDYTEKIKGYLIEGNSLTWGNIGVFERDENGQYTFRANKFSFLGEVFVQADKVIRANPEHKVLIGDRTYEGEGLATLLSNSKNKVKINYWPYIVIAFSLLLIFYLMLINNDMMEKHQQQFKLELKSVPETYIKLLSDE